MSERKSTSKAPGAEPPTTERPTTEPSSEDFLEPSQIGSRLLAFGLIGAGLLIWLGWYASTRADDEQNAALAAATPQSNERVNDDFDRPDQVLGSDDEAGLVWTVLGPDLAIVEGRVESSGQDQTSLAVTDLGWSDVSLGLVVDVPAAASGLLFRYIDLNNHWSLVAAPEFATWNLVLTVNGEVIESISGGLTGTEPGTRLAVMAEGPEIRVFVNGLPVAQTIDPTFQEATSAGLLASPGTPAVFDDFFAIDASTTTP